MKEWLEKISSRGVAVLLALVQLVTASLFAEYKTKADALLADTQAQAIAGIKRAILQAEEIALQDAELSLPVVKPQPSCGK